MLSEIKSISNFGVFSDYTPMNGLHFLKFNLFYGWNGSGKSTLSRVFDVVSGQTSTAFPNGNFKAIIKNNTYAKEGVSESDIKIVVFNQDFIKKNLDFDTHKAKSILYISEEKIEEKKKLEQKQLELQENNKSFNLKNKEADALRNEISSDLTKIAKNVKGSFGLIQTSNTKFLNYDKRKLESFIVSNGNKIKNENILSKESLEKNRLSAQSSQKPEIIEVSFLFEISNIESKLNAFKINIEKSIIASRIQKLIDDDRLNKWVGDGLSLYQNSKNENCDFCGEKIPLDRIKILEAHFSDEYQVAVNNLDKDIAEATRLHSDVVIKLSDSGDFYTELQEKIKDDKIAIEVAIKNLQDALITIQGKLKEKKENPFKVISWVETDLVSAYEKLAILITGYNGIVKEHNKKTKDFSKTVSDANETLELHFVCEQLQDNALENKKSNLKSFERKLLDLKTKQDQLSGDVKTLESQLVNAAIAADVFNDELARFLGRSDITVDFKKEHGGYQFTRGGQKELAANLSEGEKTALAFIYFITKLKESGSNIANTVIVLDDPISSFDSNHLHHAFGFIRFHMDSSLQLFILTHNFEFFKLIRDWLRKKNSSDEPEKDKSKFYLIQAKAGEVRQSEIVNLPPMLLNYESEYHFIFSKIITYRGKDKLQFVDSHFIGNSSRKILEAFLAFKYPSHKADFAGLLAKACGEDKNLYHKVYSFINRYSHSKNLEVFSGGTDNVFAESQNIVEDVLGIVKKLDENHFREMEKICT